MERRAGKTRAGQRACGERPESTAGSGRRDQWGGGAGTTPRRSCWRWSCSRAPRSAARPNPAALSSPPRPACWHKLYTGRQARSTHPATPPLHTDLAQHGAVVRNTDVAPHRRLFLAAASRCRVAPERALPNRYETRRPSGGLPLLRLELSGRRDLIGGLCCPHLRARSLLSFLARSPFLTTPVAGPPLHF